MAKAAVCYYVLRSLWLFCASTNSDIALTPVGVRPAATTGVMHTHNPNAPLTAEGGPAHIDEFYSNTTSTNPVAPRRLDSNDRVALYRQHLRGLGFQAAPVPTGVPESSVENRASRRSFFSRQTRKRDEQQHRERPHTRDHEHRSHDEDEGEDDDDSGDDDFARYRAEVAAAKRGIPPALPSRPSCSRQPGSATDTSQHDIARYRDEIAAAKARNALSAPGQHGGSSRQSDTDRKGEGKGKRGFWSRKKDHEDEPRPRIMTTRYA
ncbi:hypothetical protein K461DRAFT_265621 [Myriangium duriaei CBS 260.36]|uniref:Uncharacterized protein n=1 Tax=Myriangium duriaei CBS 260.36 TaxID=1168546 RepID=A0A9P4J7K6_9PEZI|nr:hypothetical protein K461DRAFT_265621 [Myriangium duriaei CBS 260.36]